MAKILKNTTASAVTISDTGQVVPLSSQLTISAQDYDLYAASEDVILLIADGTLVVNDGSFDLTPAQGIGLIQGSFIQRDFVDNLKNNNRLKVDILGTLSDGTVKISANDTTADFLENKIAAQNNKITIQTANDGGDEDLIISFNPENVGTSELNNDAGFVNAAQAASAAPVQSVNGSTGTVVLNASDVGAATTAQGTLADSALQSGDNISELNNDSSFIPGSSVPSFETNTTLQTIGNTLRYTNEDGTNFDIDLSVYLDDTNLARLVSGSLDGSTGIVTFTRDDSSTFTIDFSPLTDQVNSKIIAQNGHGFTLTNNVPIPAFVNSSGVVIAAQADNIDTLSAFCITEIIDSNNIRIQQTGFITATAHSLTVGEYYFLSNTTAGAITATEPQATLNDVILYVVDSNTLLLTDNRPEDKNSIEKFLIKVRNTDTSTNINTSSATTIPITGTTSINENSFYTISGNGIQVPQTRSYKLKANIHVTSTTTRPNQRIRFAINGTETGDIAATGYIRNSSGHNESSYHLNEILVLNANDIITITSTQEAAAGTVTMALSGSSSMTVEAR